MTGTSAAGVYSCNFSSRARAYGVLVAGIGAHFRPVGGAGRDGVTDSTPRARDGQDLQVGGRQQLCIGGLAKIGAGKQRRILGNADAFVLTRQLAASGPGGEPHAAALQIVHGRQHLQDAFACLQLVRD
jgi:hypothetical protein